MADLVSVADGNFNSATPWRTCSHTLISTNTGATALTTGNLDSQTFTPAATAIVGVCVRLASRNAGSPTNTMTITLRNSTTATNVKSVTVNVSDLPVSATGLDSQGGWIFLKFDATHTPNGTDAYLIRATLSATSTAVSLAHNGTGNNWQRMVVTTTTATPNTGDDLHIVGEFDGATNPATPGTRTVTMDQTAATDYGSASTNQYTAAIDISTRGVLTYGTAGSTDYVLRVSGFVSVYSNGTLSIGTSGTPIPRGSSAVLEFDCAADGDFGLLVKSGGICNLYGLSRTSGKDVVWTLLTADQSAGATSATVADDTGWLTGDEVGIASTTRTASQREIVTLTGDAGASSLAHGATANAHGGSAASKVQAEVVLITRNVIVRSVTSTNQGFVECHTGSVFAASWTLFRYLSAPGSSVGGVLFETTTGTWTLSYCCIADAERAGLVMAGAFVGSTVQGRAEHIILYNNSRNSITTSTNTATDVVVALDDFVIIGAATGLAGADGMSFESTAPAMMTVGAMRVSSAVFGISQNVGANVSFGGQIWGPFVAHSNSSTGVRLGTSARNLRFAAIDSWRNGGNGLNFAVSNYNGVIFEGEVHCFGNTTANITIGSSVANLRDVRFLATVRCSGDSTFSTGAGLDGGNEFGGLSFARVDFGTATGIYTAHTSADISINIATLNVQMDLGRATLASANEILTFPGSTPSHLNFISMMRKDESTGVHLTITALGTLSREVTTVETGPAALKMTPNVETSYPWRLESAARRPFRGYLVAVPSGSSASVSVSVQIDGSYNGNPPRLILKANAAAGIPSDVVLDTHSGATGSYETLSGTTATVDDDCVLEFVVDCNGTAGSCYVDSWSGGGDGSQDFWADGLPSSAGASDVGSGSPDPGGGGTETGFAHVG